MHEGVVRANFNAHQAGEDERPFVYWSIGDYTARFQLFDSFGHLFHEELSSVYSFRKAVRADRDDGTLRIGVKGIVCPPVIEAGAFGIASCSRIKKVNMMTRLNHICCF